MTAINANLGELASVRLPLSLPAAAAAPLPMTADFALFAPSQANLLNYDFTDSAQTAVEESSTQSLNGDTNWIDLSVEVRKVEDGINQYLPQCAINDPLILQVDQLNNSSSNQDGLQKHSSRITAAQLNAADCHMQQLLPVTTTQPVSSALSSAEFSSATAAPAAAAVRSRPASANEERRFTCQLCGKAFKRHDHLNGHLITHREKKPFECTFQGCGKSYCDARSLKRHQENHHSSAHKSDSSPSGSPDSQKTPNSPRNDSRKKSKAKSDPNEGLTTQQLELIQEIMRQTQEQHRLQQEEQQRQQQRQQPKSKKSKSRAAAAGEAAAAGGAEGNNRPVECTVCQRKFKNIPALNGHMRLHGGFLKKDPEARKTEKKDPASPPLQTASVSVRALIEEKIIQRRNMAALTPPLDQQLSPQQPQQIQTYFDGSLLSLSPSVDTQQPQQEEPDNLNDVLDAAAAASALLSDISSLDLQSYIESAQQPGDSSIYTDCLAQYLQSGAAESLFDACAFSQQPQQHDSINFSFTDTTAAYPQYFQQPQQLYPDDPNSFAEELQLLYNIKDEPDTWNSTAQPFQELPAPEETPTKIPKIPKTRRSPSKRPRIDEFDELLNSAPNLKYSSLLQQHQEVSHYVPAPLLNPGRCGQGLYSTLPLEKAAPLDSSRDRKARTNIGRDFQCTALPRCKKEKTLCKDPEAAELLWNPLWDSADVDRYLQWVQHCPPRKVSMEEALDVLHRCQGDVRNAKKMLLIQTPARKDFTWDSKTVGLFVQGMKDYGKNFAKIAQHIPSANAADCLAFYYQWKTVDVEQYKLLKQQWHAQRNSSSNNKVSESCDSCEFGSDCAISSSNNNKLEASQPEPLKTKLYPCSICNKVYDKVKSRSAHMKTHKSANWETRTKNHKAATTTTTKFNLGSTTLSPSTSSSSSSSLPSPFLPTYYEK